MAQGTSDVAAFDCVFYWSGTTCEHSTGFAWGMYFLDGTPSTNPKASSSYVWAVRDGP
jgi:hypothetical protein